MWTKFQPFAFSLQCRLNMATNFCLFLLILVISVEENVSELLVQLKSGTIRGRESSTPENLPFFAFQQIPFAAPPVGDLRFQPPQPVQPWGNILETTSNTKICYQVNKNFERETEDCLYLNVYTPKLPENGKNSSLPVMFYIYGGGFIEGDATYETYGPDFFLEYEVVVVTSNYRVGPFGFLSTQDRVIPGNNGLKDQLKALEWVRDNIDLFGGDPAKVTIFGQSAGAASVAYHLISEKSQGLFRAAILESGTALCPFAYQRNARKYAFKTAKYLNWADKSGSSKKLLKFLQSVSAADLDEASLKVHEENTFSNSEIMQGFYYAPVIELDPLTGFLTENMYERILSGKASRVPVIMGVNSEEAVSSITKPAQIAYLMAQFDENPEWLVPHDMHLKTTIKKRSVGVLIRQIYAGNDLFQNNPHLGVRYLSDTSFNRAVIEHALIQSQFSPVYFYQFSYSGDLGNVVGNIEGAEHIGHNGEIGYLWRINADHLNNSDLSVFPEQDLTTQKRLLSLWTNFAKTLNPTPRQPDVLQNVVWPTISSRGYQNFPYLDIRDNLKVENHPKKDTFYAWTEIYKTHGQRPFDTY